MGAHVQRHTHTLARAHTHAHKEQQQQICHFEMANAHPIQYGAGLTDGPSVFKAKGADLISKQVRAGGEEGVRERGGERDAPVSVQRKGPDSTAITAGTHPLTYITPSTLHPRPHLFLLPNGVVGYRQSPCKHCNQRLFSIIIRACPKGSRLEGQGSSPSSEERSVNYKAHKEWRIGERNPAAAGSDSLI